MLLKLILNEYIRVSSLSKASSKTYTDVLSKFQKDTNLYELDSLNVDVICQWRDMLLQRAKPVTWNNYRRHMRALVNFALHRGYININPFTEVKPAIEFQAETKYCSISEIKIILAALDKNIYLPGWFWKCVIKTFYYTGMRRNQLCGLTWQDIDYENNRILLRSENSKNNREWYVPLDERLLFDLLELYRRTMTVKASISVNDQVFNISLFCKRFMSDSLYPEHITKAFARIGKKLDIKFSPHRIRHNFGTQTGSRISDPGNMDLLVLKNQMGHTNFSTTTRYISPSLDPQRKIVRALADV